MGYICDSIRYLESYLGGINLKHELSVPVQTAHARSLPTTGPPFPARTPASPPQPATTEDEFDEE